MREISGVFKKVSCFLALTIILSFVGNKEIVKAKEIEYSEQIVSDVNKEWKIIFTNDLDFTTVNNSTIKILDEKSKAIALSFSQGESLKECIITPVEPYVDKKSYKLLISDKVKSANEKALKDSISMKFQVDTSAGTYNGKATVKLGVLDAFKTITIDYHNLPDAKKYRVEESTQISRLGEALRVVIPSETTTVYFYTENEKLIGNAVISVKENKSNLTFNINTK